MRANIETETAVCDICATNDFAMVVACGYDFEYESTMEEFQLLQCRKCGLVYLKERPKAEFMSVIYPSDYYSFNETKTQNHLVSGIRNWLESKKVNVYLHLLGTDKRKVFDIGCGDGRLLNLIGSRTKNLWELKVIELGHAAAHTARSKGFDVCIGDFETEDLQSLRKSIDLVLLHQVLEHTRSPRNVIRKIKSILRTGAVVSIETPCIDSWDWRLFKKRYWGGYHIPRHFYLFNKKNLLDLLTKEGFEIISVTCILSPVFWILSLHNFCCENFKNTKLAKYFHYQNVILLFIATLLDLIQVKLFAISSNMQILVRMNTHDD